MINQLTTNGEALRLFFTDDVYLINEPEGALNEQIQGGVENAMVNEPVPNNLVKPEITLPKEHIPAAPEKITEFKFLGNNKRNILILVNDEENDVSDEKGRELLRKIVKSVNLTANDFALLNYSKYGSVDFKQLQAHFSSVIVFAFGVSAKQLGLTDHPENKMVLEGSVKLIFSAELRKLEEDQNGKKVLWGSLKQLGL